MKSIILCEGKIDAILLSYYLNKTAGWKFDKKNKMKIPVVNNDMSSHCWYRNNEDELLIVGVGGNSCFDYTIEHLLNIGKLDGNNFFDRIVIITDRDKNIKDDIILKELEKNFINLDVDNNFKLENNKWNILSFDNSFGEITSVQISSIIIPFEKEGALETFLVEALTEDKDKKFIIEKVRKFIFNLNSPHYLNKERLKVKAELGVTLAIISPEKVFTELDIMISQVPWENYKNIQKGFALLDEL